MKRIDKLVCAYLINYLGFFFFQDPERLLGRKFKNTNDCLHQPVIVRF